MYSPPFIDPDFPPDDRSWRSNKIHGVERNPLFNRDDITWLPIEELHSHPVICTGGCYLEPGEQRQIGNCGFIAAANCLQMNEFCWKQVVRPERAGCDKSLTYWFCPKRGAKRVAVKIDRYLPTQGKQLAGAINDDPAEFTISLLEKAYIKFRRSTYEGIEGVDMVEVLEHFTGGVVESYDKTRIKDWPDLLLNGQKLNCMMAISSIVPKNEQEMQALENKNIYGSHAYSIVAVEQNKVILRNPWGKTPYPNGTTPFCRESFFADEPRNFDCQTSDGMFPISFDDLESFRRIVICKPVETEAEKETWPQWVPLTLLPIGGMCFMAPWPAMWFMGMLILIAVLVFYAVLIEWQQRDLNYRDRFKEYFMKNKKNFRTINQIF